jgi:heme A synthase
VRRRGLWLGLLAGPVVGYGYFWLVYLLAEASCSAGVDGLRRGVLRVVIVGCAVAAAVAIALGAWMARRAASSAVRDGDIASSDPDLRASVEQRRFVASTAMILAGIFTAFVAFVTAPTIGSTLC